MMFKSYYFHYLRKVVLLALLWGQHDIYVCVCVCVCICVYICVCVYIYHMCIFKYNDARKAGTEDLSYLVSMALT